MNEPARTLPAAASDLAPRLPNIAAGGGVRAIVPQDFESAWRVANVIVRSGMAPRGLDTPEKAMVAIMHGLEIGLTPMAALQSIAVVNGRPTVWGDGALALVRGSGLLAWMQEYFEGAEGTDGYTAVCVMQRAGEPEPIRRTFSIGDAKRAGLLGKEGPWRQYPKRMQQMRARAFAVRDGFADVLRGVSIREEMLDVETTTRAPTPAGPPSPSAPPSPPPMRDVSPPRPTAAPDPTMADADDLAMDTIDPPQADGAADPLPGMQWIERALSAVDDPDTLSDVWSTMVEPRLTQAPNDYWEQAMAVYRQHERRLAP